MARYTLTDAHRAQLKPWADKWIANAIRTRPMDDDDRAAMRVAIDGMYDAAKLSRPERVIFVASPMSGAIAASIASGAWWLREHPERHVELFGRVLSESDIMAAVPIAVAHVVRVGVAVTRGEATPPPIRIDAATDAATREATRAATRDATSAVRFLASCSQWWWRMWQGGNQWSGWAAYLSFFRHVAKLPLDYSRWQHFEAATIHGGPRYMHARFCIVSDFPTTVQRDTENRPHCDTGPFIAWRDGWSLYQVHGVRVPADIIDQPASITVERIDAETNSEVRRVMIERYGHSRYMVDSSATLVAKDEMGELYRREVRDDEPIVMVRVLNSTPEPDGTTRIYWLRVPPTIKTPQEAVAWTFDLRPEEYMPSVQT